jgi:hypothetical protein
MQGCKFKLLFEASLFHLTKSVLPSIPLHILPRDKSSEIYYSSDRKAMHEFYMGPFILWTKASLEEMGIFRYPWEENNLNLRFFDDLNISFSVEF